MGAVRGEIIKTDCFAGGGMTWYANGSNREKRIPYGLHKISCYIHPIRREYGSRLMTEFIISRNTWVCINKPKVKKK